MGQNSRIIRDNFNNSQDLFLPFNQRDDNNYDLNSPLSNSIWTHTNMNIQSSPTSLNNNNNLSDRLNANDPDFLSNHSLLSKKIKRDEDEDSENSFKNIIFQVFAF